MSDEYDPTEFDEDGAECSCPAKEHPCDFDVEIDYQQNEPWRRCTCCDLCRYRCWVES